jgi:hypothetical protein
MKSIMGITIMVFILFASFYYFLLRPDAIQNETQIRQVVRSLKGTDTQNTTQANDLGAVAGAFGVALEKRRKVLPPGTPTEQRIQALGISNDDQLAPALSKWLDGKAGVDESEIESVLASRPQETTDAILGIIEQYGADESEQRSSVFRALRRLNFDEHGKQVASSAMTNWTYNQDWGDQRKRLELSQALDALGVWNIDAQNEMIENLRSRYSHNKDFIHFLEAQYDAEPSANENAPTE